MKTYAAILAAGNGTRFGGDKTQAQLGRKPVWRWSYDTYSAHPEIAGVVLVGSTANIEALREVETVATSLGGETRQESSLIALESLPSDADAVLIHDAARPFVTSALITDVLTAVDRSGAAAAATKVTDTIKEVGAEIRTLDRSRLVAMQTPQGAKVDLLQRAHRECMDCLTDEMAMIERLGVHPEIVEGDPRNFKITTKDDLTHARALISTPEIRTGLGYDIHPFSPDTSRTLFLGGVAFPDHPALDGHSDADVLLHAATDALLGAASLGDIGVHFPNTDPQWRGAPSLTFLRHAGELLERNGWRLVNLDMTVIAESPKVMKRSEEIRGAIANTLSVEIGRISLKATTNERLGAIGRQEGIAAFATATISERL